MGELTTISRVHSQRVATQGIASQADLAVMDPGAALPKCIATRQQQDVEPMPPYLNAVDVGRLGALDASLHVGLRWNQRVLAPRSCIAPLMGASSQRRPPAPRWQSSSHAEAATLPMSSLAKQPVLPGLSRRHVNDTSLGFTASSAAHQYYPASPLAAVMGDTEDRGFFPHRVMPCLGRAPTWRDRR